MLHAAITILHTRKKCFRRFSALVLAAVQCAIILAPLAPVTLHSGIIFHYATGECAGDCSVCGCPPESKGRSCCCVRKRQREHQLAVPMARGCCSSGSAPDASAETPRAEAPPAGQSGEAAVRVSCRDSKHPNQPAGRQEKPDGDSSRSVTVFSCGCPCGSGKALAPGEVSFELLLPGSGPVITLPRTYPSPRCDRGHPMTSRHREPPDPPPKLPILS